MFLPVLLLSLLLVGVPAMDLLTSQTPAQERETRRYIASWPAIQADISQITLHHRPTRGGLLGHSATLRYHYTVAENNYSGSTQIGEFANAQALEAELRPYLTAGNIIARRETEGDGVRSNRDIVLNVTNRKIKVHYDPQAPEVSRRDVHYVEPASWRERFRLHLVFILLGGVGMVISIVWWRIAEVNAREALARESGTVCGNLPAAHPSGDGDASTTDGTLPFQPISPWMASLQLPCPDGRHIATIATTRAIGMGKARSGNLTVSNGVEIPDCSPAMIWSSDSAVLAVPQWDFKSKGRQGPTLRILVVDVDRKIIRVVPGSYPVLWLKSFSGGILTVINSSTRGPPLWRIDTTQLHVQHSAA